MKLPKVLGINCGAYPTRLVPNVAKLSGRRDGSLFYKRSDGIPNACGVKRPSYGSGKVGKEMKVSALVLNHCLDYLALKPEVYHSSGSLADVNVGGRPIPAAGVLGAGLPEEINLLTQVKGKG